MEYHKTGLKLYPLIKRQSVIHTMLSCLALLFLATGYYLEEPYIRRALFLVAFSLVFMVLLLGVYIFKSRNIIPSIIILLMTASLIAIEYFSKYSINYLYHVLYFIVVLAVALYFDRRQGIKMAAVVTLASFLKFIQLIYIEMTQNNIATFIFYSVIQILLISMVFVTKAYRVESKKTKNLYQELLDAYQQLDIYSKDIEVLSAKEERASIARDLHDTLGHDLTGLIMQLELANYNLDRDEALGRKYLEESVESARTSLTKVRAIVDTLKNQEKLVFTKQSLGDLVEEYEHRTGISVILEVKNEEAISPDYLLIIYWIIQEALTNVAKHSKNDQVRVSISHSNQGINFEIEDISKNFLGGKNQKTSEFLKKGNGLKGMEERLVPLGGQIAFYQVFGGYKGFLLKGYIPKERG